MTEITSSLDEVVAKGRREIARLIGREGELLPGEVRALAEWSTLLDRIQRRREIDARRSAGSTPLSDIAELLKDDPEVQRLLDAPVVKRGKGKK